MNVIASAVTRRGTRLLESFSKVVERREAVKLYLAHKLARVFFAVESQILVCALKTRVPGTGYTRLLEFDLQADATLHVCHSHSFVKLHTCER